MTLTAERLRELLDYDPETGVFRWRVRPSNNTVIGGEAGSNKGAYTQVCIGWRQYAAHRLAWLYVHGRWPIAMIDHINHVPSDNRIANLREASPGENRRNSKRHSTNKSGFKGIWLHRPSGKWAARIKLNGRSHYLGHHETPEAAHAAYRAAAKELHGDFARFD